MKPILEIMRELGELAQAGSGSDRDRRLPPLYIWRFKTAQPDLERRIVDAVRAYRGATAWTIEKRTLNWLLAPTHYCSYEYAGSQRASQYGVDFPVETQTANDDVVGLAAHLRRELLGGRDA